MFTIKASINSFFTRTFVLGLLFGIMAHPADAEPTISDQMVLEGGPRDGLLVSKNLYGTMGKTALFECDLRDPQSQYDGWSWVVDKFNVSSARELVNGPYYVLTCSSIAASAEAQQALEAMSRAVSNRGDGAYFVVQALLEKTENGYYAQTHQYVRASRVGELQFLGQSWGDIRVTSNGYVWLLPSSDESNPDASSFQLLTGKERARQFFLGLQK